MRDVPEVLARRVYELSDAIAADPYGRGVTALEELRALYDSMASAGTPDPFLTEALADRTSDAREAIRLYEVAIAQCVDFPGEPIHTKRRDMAARLIETADNGRAREQLELAIIDARRDGEFEDAEALAKLLYTLSITSDP